MYLETIFNSLQGQHGAETLASDGCTDERVLACDTAEKALDYAGCLKLLEALKTEEAVLPNVLWRLARTHERLFQQASTDTDRLSCVEQGLQSAQRATAINPNSAKAHKYLAMFLSMEGDVKGTKIMVGNLDRILTHAKQSIALFNNDPSPHHLLGRVLFSLAKASWVERNAAKMINGTLPPATFDEALQGFMESDKVERRKNNCLWAAKTFFKLSKKKEGKEWLDICLDMPVVTPEDKTVHAEAVSLKSP